MVLLSLMSSVLSLYRITQVNQILEAINHVSVPMGRLLTQMQSDAEVFHRELERSLGYSHWKDPEWKPRPAPKWIESVLENEMLRVKELIQVNSEWAEPEARNHWREWVEKISQELNSLGISATQIYSALDKKDDVAAAEAYSKGMAKIEDWKRQLQWGSAEFERSLRQSFATTESRVAELRTGLEVILVIVVLMTLLFIWLGERALRPLAELTYLAREITRRGLRKADKSLLPSIPISRSDEVSQLAREFHHMATALLEREKTVETQKDRLQEQNQLLREMGELNINILDSIESVLIVTDLQGTVTQCNPGAVRWLENSVDEIRGSQVMKWSKIKQVFQGLFKQEEWLKKVRETAETWKVGPVLIEDKIYGGYVIPLRQEQGETHGAILILDDLTEETDLQERLRRAENLAAIGRMSAQVAHEVRNPLHSIGLEAEMAIEMATRLGHLSLRQSLSSILTSVDRLQKITENYLKLSRLSEGQRSPVNVGEVLESVSSTYSPVCEVQGVQIEWRWETHVALTVHADPDLLEQVLGNLFRNSLQALEGYSKTNYQLGPPTIRWSLGNTETGKLWLRIEDNGPGIHPEIKSRLFTPFVTTRAHGTGLGLSFVKKVLEDHGGSIINLERSAEQGVKQQGACFEVTLPLLEGTEISNSESEETVDAKNFISR